jgi:hypothetical protein
VFLLFVYFSGTSYILSKHWSWLILLARIQSCLCENCDAVSVWLVSFALCVSSSLYFRGGKKKERRALGFGTGNAIDDDCFYFISWLSKGLIIYQWRMQGMKFGGAGCDIYIYPLIASLISVPHRLKDSRQDCLLLLLFDSFFHDQDSRQT